jgi:uncharacterized repeat protein (TIGR01451 family)
MTPTSRIGQVSHTRITPPTRTRKRGARPEGSPARGRCRLWLEQLETRVTPSVNPATPLELDGNATTQSTTTHDWDQVFADAGSPATVPSMASFSHGPTSLALAGAFINDSVNSTSDDIFQGGGSKDTQGIRQGAWLFTGSKPQGKDDITHAYAAAYTDPGNGHLLLYAGLDRFDNSGDSTAGFWFFGNNIRENPNVTTNGGHPFIGTHQNGDILLVSDFTIGGSTSTIKVFRWTQTNPNDETTGSLVALINGNPISGNTFAIVNGAPISTPWSYTNKSGQNQPQAGEFLEEGVDLTALGLQGCFSTFMAETRSSQSPTATLSDFALGSFPLCSLATQPFSGLSKYDTRTGQGDLVTYPLTVKNTGAMPLYIQSVSDTLLGNIVVNHTLQAPVAPVTSISSSFDFSTPLGVGQSLTIFVTRPVQAADPDPTVSTTTFVGTDDLAGTEDPITASTPAPGNVVNLFQPSATLSETASPTAGTIGTPVTYTYTVTNTSSPDSPNLVLDLSNPNDSFTSTLFGDLEADAIHAATGSSTATVASIAPGASFSFSETHVISTGDLPGPITDSSVAHFTLAQNLGPFPNIIFTNTAVAPVVHIVSATVGIAPNAVNEVGQPHTFTVTVNQIVDGVSSAAAGANVTATLTSINGANAVPSTLLSGTTNSSGQFQVTFTSLTAGQVIGNATATLSVLGVSLTRATGDSNAGDSGPATKTFEDATISIAPNATNGITEPHTFTVTVLDNAGDGKGFVAAANAPVTVTLTGQNGAVPIAETPLSGTTNASGQFQVTFTSDSAGQVIGNASATFTLNGVTLARATGDSHTGDGGPATKTFVAGKILWKKVDGFGNLLGGATFLVTATGGTAATLSPTSVTVLDNGSFDANPANGLFELDAFQSFGGSKLTGLALGTYTIQEITPPPGYTLDPKVLTVTLTQSSLTGDVTSTPFVDTLPNLNIVKTVTANQTVIHPGGTASFTITVSNPNPTGGTAGTAANVVMTDNLPDASQLTWTVTSFTGFTSASISASGVLTATEASMPGGGTASVVVSAAVPLSFFGNTSSTGNGDAVPSNLFEIDGNATVDTTGGHDWNQVFADNTANPKTNTAGAIASSFVTDETTGDDIYTGGSTKDTLPVSGWLFKTGKPQDKDEILHAYAAQYVDPITKDVILYTGADRFSNSGDSTMGFWFFVNPISKSTNANVSGSGAPFVGTHTDGDILLISNFTIGGSQSTIAVYKWVGNDSTGSLQFVGQTSSTVAVVNSGSPGVAWPFTDKAGFSQPQAGEFIEEGVNLSGLGLNGCFSTFLAETRSSQSTTATLSDFVLGSFSTCDVMLPNQASVSASNFNNGQPITSNQVVIDVNDGMPQLAASAGTEVAIDSLTAAQLQPIVAQAVAAWRAAGADPLALSNVANYAIHIAKLPDGELGWELPGQIWIDATAAGWGWSLGSTPVPGRMDLLTVVSHEVGHVLGFGDHASGNDIMTTALATGVRRLPEALPGTGSVTVVAVSAGSTAGAVGTGSTAGAVGTGFRAGDLGVSLPAASSATETADAAFAPAVRSGVTPPQAAGQARAVAQHSVSAVLNDRPQQAPPMIATPSLATVIGAPDEVPGAVLIPGLWPPAIRLDSAGGDGAIPGDAAGDAEQVALPLSAGSTAGAPRDGGAQAGVWFRALAGDACFDDGSWALDPAGLHVPWPGAEAESSGPAADAAAAALAVVLGGCWAAPRAEPEARTRRRFLR